MKKYFNYFIYISLLFLIIALYRADYLVIPVIFNYTALILSFILLVLGFLANSLQYKIILKRFGIQIAYQHALIGIGMTVFGKYIPGKIWMILGKAAYISSISNAPVNKISLVSFDNQFITLWVGLIMGFVGITFIGGLHLWGWITFGFWIFLSFIIFSPVFRIFIKKSVRLFLKKEIDLPSMSFSEIISMIPIISLTWIIWSFGLYFLIWALSGENTSIWNTLAFPMSVSLGILAIISPGGLGIREGIMTAYLKIGGLDTSTAVTITIMARLWFLVGEFFIFFIALYMKNVYAKK